MRKKMGIVLERGVGKEKERGEGQTAGKTI